MKDTKLWIWPGKLTTSYQGLWRLDQTHSVACQDQWHLRICFCRKSTSGPLVRVCTLALYRFCLFPGTSISIVAGHVESPISTRFNFVLPAQQGMPVSLKFFRVVAALKNKMHNPSPPFQTALSSKTRTGTSLSPAPGECRLPSTTCSPRRCKMSAYRYVHHDMTPLSHVCSLFLICSA